MLNKKSEIKTFILVGETNVQGRDDPVSVFQKVMPELKTADILFGHMEGLLYPSTREQDLPYKPQWKHSSPDMIEAYKEAGFDAVSCASNVSYGEKAILNTIEILKGSGIEFCGIGENLKEARKPALVEKEDLTLGFLSYTSVFWPVGLQAGENSPGAATIAATTQYEPNRRTIEMPGVPPIVRTNPVSEQLSAMEKDIKKLKEKTDIIVLSCHWGVSKSEEITDYQQIIAHTAIEAGADLILGHHPHVIQPIEIWKGCPIFYSLGNFAFDWIRMRHRNKVGLMLKCMIKGKSISKVSFVPVYRNKDNLVEIFSAEESKGKEIVSKAINRSQTFGTKFNVNDEKVDIIIKN